MLFNLSISAIKDFVALLKEEKNFFEKNEDQRNVLISEKFGENFPSSLANYLSKVSVDNFLEDIKNVVLYIKDIKPLQENKFFDAMCHFISEDLGILLDKVDGEFFFKAPGERKKFLDKFLTGNSYFLREFEDLVLFSTYQDLNDTAQNLLNKLKEAPIVIVESAASIDSDTKTQIRKYFIKTKEFSFVEFRINKNIIGGVRVFVDGTLVDLSWMGKLRGLSKLKV